MYHSTKNISGTDLAIHCLNIVMAKPKKKSERANKLGVKNSLVNNINARKEKDISRDKKDSTIDDESYKRLEGNWDREMYS